MSNYITTGWVTQSLLGGWPTIVWAAPGGSPSFDVGRRGSDMTEEGPDSPDEGEAALLRATRGEARWSSANETRLDRTK